MGEQVQSRNTRAETWRELEKIYRNCGCCERNVRQICDLDTDVVQLIGETRNTEMVRKVKFEK